ncbi:MAG: hypothetical protein MJY57_02055 [Bacteroidales bacterium]|nr:hypothetical protein [Bacteroidales bacterium]
MKKIFALIAAAAVLATACTKQNAAEKQLTKVTVSTCELTKTSMGGNEEGTRSVFWSVGDAICINGVPSQNLTSEDINAAGTTATFKFEGLIDKPYNVYYPASGYKDASTITLPSVQGDANGDNFANGAVPLYGYLEGEGGFKMHQLCAILKIQLKKKTHAHDIKYVEFSGNGGEQVCGSFTLDYQTGALTPTSTASADRAVKVAASRTLSTEEVSVVNICIPAGTYTDGFKVRVVDVSGHYMDKAKASESTIERGNIYVMSPFEFEPTGTIMDIEIDTGGTK